MNKWVLLLVISGCSGLRHHILHSRGAMFGHRQTEAFNTLPFQHHTCQISFSAEKKVLGTDSTDPLVIRPDKMSGLFRENKAAPIKNYSTSIMKELDPVAEILKDCQDLYNKYQTAGRKSVKSLDAELVVVIWRLQYITNKLIGSSSTVDSETRVKVTEQARELLTPLAKLGSFPERMITKPRGYAGDFLTIDWIYENEAKSVSPFAKALHKAMLTIPACEAVRNRRGMLRTEFGKLMKAKQGEHLQVTSLACGPAREVQDILVENPDGHAENTSFHLLDLDDQALEVVKGWRNDLHLDASRVALHQKNLIHLCRGTEQLDIPPQDLVYSMGLIDYFKDRVVISLLDYIYDSLKPGGRVILGNFHNRNPSLGLMDSVLDWQLIHRDEDDLNRIFARSKFNKGCSEFIYDVEGVQLLACCEKN